jgi:hypothetical protein
MGHRNLMRATVTPVSAASADVAGGAREGARPARFDAHALEGKDAERMLKLMDAMDDCDDVQKVYTNADIPDDLVEAM